MGLYRKVSKPVRAYSFDEFVQFGLMQPDVNIVNGKPWSFTFFGGQVTHENDERYFISTIDGTIDFTPEKVIIVKGSDTGLTITTTHQEYFKENYENINQ